MNSKSSKQYKSAAISKKSKENKKGEPEVLIIPPNLLEKFGLTFGDIHTLGNTSIPEHSNNKHKKRSFNKTSKFTETEKTSHEKGNEFLDVNKETLITNETSIMETANLMKESVFLSPTFVPTVANTIPGEVEIISSCDKLCCLNEEPVKQMKVSHDKDVVSVLTDDNKLLSEENQKLNNLTHETTFDKDSKEIKTEMSIVIRKLSIEGNKIVESDHPIDEKDYDKNTLVTNMNCYKNLENIKQFNNFNSVEETHEKDPKVNVVNKSTNLNSFDFNPKVQNKSQNRIKIISEEIVNYQLRPVHEVSKSPHKNSLVLVSMDTIIAKKENNNSTFETSNCRKLVDTVNTTKCDIITTNEQTHESLKDVTLRNSFAGADLELAEPEVILNKIPNDHTFPSMKSNDILHNSNKSILDADNRQYFSNNLGEITREKNEDYSTINTNNNDSDITENLYFDDVSSSKLKCNIEFEDVAKASSKKIFEVLYDTIITEENDKSTLDLIRDEETPSLMLPSNVKKIKQSINSPPQLCVHGIEKPGGNEEFRKCNMSVKTYLAKKINRTNKTSIDMQNQLISEITKKVDEITLKEDTFLDIGLKTLQYCVCDDFGRLKNYDCTFSPSEHIHFWHTETINCKPEIIYEIYNDNKLVDSQYDTEITENISPDSEISYICWNGIHTQSYANSNEILSKALLLSRSKSHSSREEETNNRTTKIDCINMTSSPNNKKFQKSNKINNFDKNADKIQPSSAQIDLNEKMLVENKTELKNEKEKDAKCIELPMQYPSKHVSNREKGIGTNEKMEISSVSNLIASDEVTTIQSAQTFIKLVNDAKIDNSMSVPVNSAIDTGMVLMKSKYNNYYNSIHKTMKDEADSSSNFEITGEITTRIPKKVYPNVARGIKRNIIDSIEGSIPESVGKKRCDRRGSTDSPSIVSQASPTNKLKCRKCHRLLYKKDCEEHALHTHLKWNITQKKDLETDDFQEELYDKLKVLGMLNCDLCLFKVNHVPTFILHIEQCIDLLFQTNEIETEKKMPKNKRTKNTITCGVCKNVIKSKKFWMDHIRTHHNYLAWKDGELKLNLNNKKEVQHHLHSISKETGALTCTCGYASRYAKSYLNHIKTCEEKVSRAAPLENNMISCETVIKIPKSDDKNDSGNSEADTVGMDQNNSVEVNIEHLKSECVECGVCNSQVDTAQWIAHIQLQHHYLAWKIGETPLNLNNDEEVRQHLHSISKEEGTLSCACGFAHKYAKSYLKHIKTCGEKVPRASLQNNEVSCETQTKIADTDIKVHSRNSESENVIVDQDVPRAPQNNVASCETETEIPNSNSNIVSKNPESDNVLMDQDNIDSENPESDNVVIDQDNIDSENLESDNVVMDQNNSVQVNTKHLKSEYVECGVCNSKVDTAQWISHIQLQHDYLARKVGETPLNLNNDEEVRQHLHSISKVIGALKCACGYAHKYPKSYLKHVKTCEQKVPRAPQNNVASCETETGIPDSDSNIDSKNPESDNVVMDQDNVNSENPETDNAVMDQNNSVQVDTEHLRSEYVECGVCNSQVDTAQWISHIQLQHDYLAWKVGETPLNLNNDEEVRQHLHSISKEKGALKCACGYAHKYPKSYLKHVKTCEQKVPRAPQKNVASCETETGIPNSDSNIDLKNPESDNVVMDQDNIDSEKPESDNVVMDQDNSVQVNTEHLRSKYVECGVCNSQVDTAQWISHIQLQHDYLAWKLGETPLNLNNDEEVRQHLHSISKEKGALKCVCGYAHKYPKSYLKHVKTCEQKVPRALQNNVASCETEIEIPNSDSNIFSENPKSDNVVMDQDNSVKVNIEPSSSNYVECGVCNSQVDTAQWISHIQLKHGYLSWKVGETPLNIRKRSDVLNHLKGIVTEYKSLICANCGLSCKYAKSYMSHAKKCDSNVLNESDIKDCDTTLDCSQLDNTESSSKVLSLHEKPKRARLTTVSSDSEDGESLLKLSQKKPVVCGVCAQEFQVMDWFKHIQQQHNYLAWKVGDLPLNLEDEECVRQHLYSLSKKFCGLYCSKCNFKYKYVKSYLEHTRTCTGTVAEAVDDVAVIEKNNGALKYSMDTPSRDKIKCGVCKMELRGKDWTKHLQQAHNYLAWKDGEPSINLDNEEEVRQHLHKLIKTLDGLVCSKCNSVWKCVKTYLGHMRTCSESNVVDTIKKEKNHGYVPETTTLEAKTITCGVCDKKMQESFWIVHIEREHNYLAWKDGEPVLNVNDEEAVSLHLNDLSKQLSGLLCIKCKRVQKHVKSYMNHIKTCGVSNPVKTHADVPATDTDNTIKCGVCNQVMQESLWIQHIQDEHNYLAWKDGETVLNLEDEEAVRQHLLTLTKKLNGLYCSKCKCVRKYVKKYVDHIKICDGSTPEPTAGEAQDVDLIVCGVCEKNMLGELWLSHIEKEHNYLAWIKGETPLDIENEERVRQHLNTISRTVGTLTCSKCGAKRKYVKSYIEHIKCCVGADGADYDQSIKLNDTIDISYEYNETKCAVCSKIIQPGNWIKHIQIAHNYLAWKEGTEPIDTNNDYAVREHLRKILKIVPTLRCTKCGLSRRFAKYYLDHMKTCDIKSEGAICEDKESLLVKNKGLFECAVCHEKVKPKEWGNHAMNKHYNVAWVVGDIPINLKSPYGAEKHLKQYQEAKGKLVCLNCGTSRASLMGFYVHIITCGKTEEETEMYKDKCEICGKLYLGVYKSQHLTMHKEKELENERKSAIIDVKTEDENVEVLPGRRKAAEKAKSVIEKYKTNSNIHDFNCDDCYFSTDTKKEFLRHKCNKDDEDVEEVVTSEEDSSEPSSDGDNYSDVSDEGDDPIHKRKPSDAIRQSCLTFEPINEKEYMQKFMKNFRNLHFTEENLFMDWNSLSYECLECEDEVIKYMPKLAHSCQVNINRIWLTYNRFEGKYQTEVYSMFVGGSIQCISWVPPRLGDNRLDSNYLAVVGHLDSDTPRINCDDLAKHPGLVQIWDFGTFSRDNPKFVLGLVHDYGTVWSIDWCPSGTRDVFTADSEENRLPRLGLMAIACSNGSAYICSVPYPESLTKSAEKLFFKLKPLAELRFTMKSESRIYQATTVNWSKKNGHSVVVVGYADGHVASFDVTNMSPLLSSTENDVTIFYPYDDMRMLNSCLTAMDTFPARSALLPDAVCAASPTGAIAGGGACGAVGRVVARVPAHFTAFMPAGPVAFLGGDDGLVNNAHNELLWYGTGQRRRLGVIRTGAGCIRCGRVLIYAPPLLRTTWLFPSCNDIEKKTVATIKMKSLSMKTQNEKYKNDELSMKVEPITYDGVVKKYGVEFTALKTSVKSRSVPKDPPIPERFPLADVTSLAYCPSAKCHEMAAVATHAGVIFVFKAR